MAFVYGVLTLDIDIPREGYFHVRLSLSLQEARRELPCSALKLVESS
jgi:hypothetical protein